MPALEDVGTFNFSNKDEDDDIVTDINNMDTTIQVKDEIQSIPPFKWFSLLLVPIPNSSP
nr:conserved hypothetical protein [Tanacetum cinerariifolium]